MKYVLHLLVRFGFPFLFHWENFLKPPQPIHFYHWIKKGKWVLPFQKRYLHKKMLHMFHLLSYDLIQSEASKYKVSNVSSPSVVDSLSVNSCSYELLAMNPSFIFIASASSSSPSLTSLSKALLPSSCHDHLGSREVTQNLPSFLLLPSDFF